MSKKKIGILTFHFPINEGAVLQAYCLSNFLLDQLSECDIEFIDYINKKDIPPLLDLSDERNNAIYNFSRSLPLSKKFFLNEEISDLEEYINNEYDALIVGSDEIWSLDSAYPKYFSPIISFLYKKSKLFFPYFPNPYWPSSNIRIKKISYAPCIGRTSIVNIPEESLRIIADRINNIELLSVRNKNTEKFLTILNKNLSERINIVSDPTFSYDFLSSVNYPALKDKLKQYGLDFSSPLLVVVCPDTLDPINKIIEKYKSKGYQVVGMSIKNNLVDVDLSNRDINPLEWSAIFGFSDICISSRMHGCICSILNKKPFIAVDFYANEEKLHSKIGDLMADFGIEKYHYRVKFDSPEKVVEIYDFLSHEKWPDKKMNEEILNRKKVHKEFADKIRKMLG